MFLFVFNGIDSSFVALHPKNLNGFLIVIFSSTVGREIILMELYITMQVLGEGNKRIVTLSHRAQMRRFTSDMLRVLKGQPLKQMKLSQLPQVFERALGRPFDPIDYGLCSTEDLVAQLSQNTVIVSGSGDDTQLEIPKREQTAEEIERTKEFSKEVGSPKIISFSKNLIDVEDGETL
jgi:hypothetical protein